MNMDAEREPVYKQPCRIEVPLTISGEEFAKMICNCIKERIEMKVNVLGTEYRIRYVPSLDGRGGETDFYTKEIRISEQEDVPLEFKTDNLKEMQNHVLRHELIHAFLFESGMDQSSTAHEAWAVNEEMIDWMAIQMPKIMDAYDSIVKQRLKYADADTVAPGAEPVLMPAT